MAIGTIEDAKKLAANLASKKNEKIQDDFMSDPFKAPFLVVGDGQGIANASVFAESLGSHPIPNSLQALNLRFWQFVHKGYIKPCKGESYEVPPVFKYLCDDFAKTSFAIRLSVVAPENDPAQLAAWVQKYNSMTIVEAREALKNQPQFKTYFDKALSQGLI